MLANVTHRVVVDAAPSIQAAPVDPLRSAGARARLDQLVLRGQQPIVVGALLKADPTLPEDAALLRDDSTVWPAKGQQWALSVVPCVELARTFKACSKNPRFKVAKKAIRRLNRPAWPCAKWRIWLAYYY